MKKRISSLLLVLLFLFPAAALAFNHYSLDVDALKAVEQEDTFDVRITRKVVTDDVKTDTIYNRDLLSFEITNGSPYTLSQLTILAVCHDEEGKAATLTGSYGYSLIIGSEKRTLQVLTFEPAGAEPGAVFTVSVACEHAYFSGVRALVAQITAADGQVFTNPLYERWQEVALGSPTHILD